MLMRFFNAINIKADNYLNFENIKINLDWLSKSVYK